MSDGTVDVVLRLWQAISSSILIILVTSSAFGKSETTAEWVFKYPNAPLWTFTWHDDLVAGDTFGGELVTVAVVAEQGLILAGEGLICQRAITAETAETVLVIMPVLVEEFLAVTQKQQHVVISKRNIISLKSSLRKVFSSNTSQTQSLCTWWLCMLGDTVCVYIKQCLNRSWIECTKGTVPRKILPLFIICCPQ